MTEYATNSDRGEGSEFSENSSENSHDIRPNKWIGPSSTWRSYTENERHLTKALLQARDENLSLHLYNAHALKRRHYDETSASKLQPCSSKERWRKKDDLYDPDEDRFVPPKIWTAWPLPDDEVPRTGEQIGPADLEEKDVYKREDEEEPSRELEDVLVAMTLRLAKQKFERRGWEEDGEQMEFAKSGEAETSLKSSEDDIGFESQEGSLIQSLEDGDENQEQKAPISQNDSLVSDVGMHRPSWSQMEIDDGMLSINSEEQASGSVKSREEEPIKEELGGVAPTHLRPVVTADDEQSRKLLHPTVRHTLSRLDELLMAMHHTRQACFRHGSESDSQSEQDGAIIDDSDEGRTTGGHSRSSSKGSKRGVGRPRKIYDLSAAVTEAFAEAEPELLPAGPTKKKRGRPKQVHTPHEGETHTQMLLRIARKQKKPIRFIPLAPPDEQSSSPLKSSPARSRRRSSSPSQGKVHMRLGLRDWSEVMGTAALVGFSPDVIARATQRCASLFGEGMQMRHLNMDAKPEQDVITDYIPEAIPDIPVSESSSNESNTEDMVKQKTVRRKQVRKSKRGTTEAGDAFWCPYGDCPRHSQGFKRSDHMRSHLKRAHMLTDAEVAKLLLGGEGDIEDGIHNDGFLRPLKRLGQRGKDATTRKRSRSRNRGKETNDDDDDDDGDDKEGEVTEEDTKVSGYEEDD